MGEREGFLTDSIRKAVIGVHSIAGIDGIPDEIKRIFRTAYDIRAEWHILIQAAFQRHTDNAVSKTIIFPNSAATEDVENAYIMAFDSGLKGITIYRDGSREHQVLSVETKQKTGSRRHLKPRPRPSLKTGVTEKIKTGCGNLYVTVNCDENGLCEVFCQMGRSGGCTSSQSEAISRLISLALRSGVNVDEIVSQLKGIRCPSPVWQNNHQILSCSDAIAKALSRYIEMTNTQISVSSETSNSTLEEMAGVCPDCGGTLHSAEGCIICKACGFSRCN